MNGKFNMMSGEITLYRLCFYFAKISISQYDVTRDSVFSFECDRLQHSHLPTCTVAQTDMQ